MGMDRKIEKKWWSRKRIIQLSSATIFIFFIIYLLFFTDASSRLNVSSERITISEVFKGPFQVYIPLSGTVLPIKTFYLDAIEGGRVEKVDREAGSFVNKGDTILHLTNTNLLMNIMNREAQLFEQRNNLRNSRLQMERNSLSLEAELAELDYEISVAERKYNRNKTLLDRELIPKEEFEDSRDKYEYLKKNRDLTIKTQYQDSIFRSQQIHMLEQSVDRIQTNLEFVRQNLENLVLRAPVSGQLTSLDADIGQSKREGERLGQIDVLDGFKVRAEIDEYYIGRLDIGLPGNFDLDGTTYQLKVTKIYPEVRDGRFAVDMEFVGTPPGEIRRGQTVHVRLALGDTSECLQLPRGGFYQNTGGNWAYVLDESGDEAIKREIRLGRMNPKVFEVLEGLNAGDRVITSSYDNFGDVDKIVLKQ
jgi:HlyD family secretion protein